MLKKLEDMHGSLKTWGEAQDKALDRVQSGDMIMVLCLSCDVTDKQVSNIELDLLSKAVTVTVS